MFYAYNLKLVSDEFDIATVKSIIFSFEILHSKNTLYITVKSII